MAERVLKINILGDERGARTALGNVGKAAEEMGGKLSSVSQKFEAIGRSAERAGRQFSVALTGPILALGTAASVVGANYEAELSKIVGLVGVAQDQVNEWGRDILKMAPQLGKAPQELAQALFFVTSAGFRGAEAMEVLEMAAKASAAGMGDTATIADAVTSAINAYGPGVLSAGQATDILVAAVREGKLEASSLAPVLGRLLPTASAMGIGFEQVAGTLAVMSRTGLDAAESSTSLQAVMSTMLKPTKQASDMLEGAGLSMDDLRNMAAQPGGLIQVMRLLDETFGDNDEALSQIVPNVRAFRGVMNVLAQDADIVDSVMGGVADSAGALDHAFEAAANTARFQFNQAIAQGRVLLIELSMVVLPMVIRAFGVLQRILTAAIEIWRGLSPEVQRNIVVIAGLVAAIGPVLLTFGKLMLLVSALLSPIGLLAGGIALLGTVFATNLGGIRDIVTGVVGTIVDHVNILVDVFTALRSGSLRELVDALVNVPSFLMPVANAMMQFSIVVRSVGRAFHEGGILAALRELGEQLPTIGAALLDFGNDVLSGIWDSIRGIDWADIASTIWDGIQDALSTVLSAGIAAGQFGVSVLSWAYDQITSIDWRDVASTVLSGIVTAVTTAASTVTGIGANILDWISGHVSGINWRDLAGTILSGIVSGVTTAASTVTDAGSRVRDWIGEQLSDIEWRDVASTVLGGIRDRISTAATAVRGAGERLRDWITAQVDATDWSGIASTIQGHITTGFSALSTQAMRFEPFERLVTWIRGTAMPIIRTLADFIGDRLAPIFDTWRKSFAEVADIIRNETGPLVDDLRSTGAVLATLAAIVGGILLVALGGLFNALGAVLPSVVRGAINSIRLILNTVGLLADFITGAVRIIARLLQGDFAGAWQAARDTVSRMASRIMTIIGILRDEVINRLRMMVDFAVGLFRGMYNTLVGRSIIPDMVNAILGWITLLRDWLADRWNAIRSRALEIWSDVKTRVVNLATGLRDSVVGAITTARDWLRDRWNSIRTKAVGTWDGIKETITLRAQELRDNIDEAISEARDWIAETWDEITTKVTETWDGVSTKVSETWDSIEQHFIETKDDMVAAALAPFNDFKTEAEEIMNSAFEKVDEIWGKIKGVLDKLPGIGGVGGNIPGGMPGMPGFVRSVAGTVSQLFGSTPYSRSGAYSGHPHTGVDIAAPSGTPILAAGAGRVIQSGWNGGYGNAVTIDHGNGLQTLYGHMREILSNVGQAVNAGALIGLVGSTGFSTGPHLHLELRRNGVPVDPAGIVPFAEGGLVRAGRPVVGRIGEGRHDEVISPIPTLKQALREALIEAGMGQHPIVVNQTINGMQPGDVQRETRRALRQAATGWGVA